MIAVAGGTGHLGVELIPLLTARGERIRVLTRDPDGARQRLGDVAEFTLGDAQNPRCLPAALKGADAMVSAMTGFGPNRPGPRAVDYEGNLNLIRAAEAAGVRRFVLVSMHGAAAGHPMELVRMKHRAEEALEASQLDWVIVRPTVFMELWAGIVGDPIMRTGKTTVFGRGDNPINFNSVRDVARFVELALFDTRLTRAILDVGGPENVTFNQLVQQLELAAGRKATVKHLPLPLMWLSQRLMRPFRPDVAGMIQAGIAFDTLDMSFDATKLRQQFPQIQLTTLAQVTAPHFDAARE